MAHDRRKITTWKAKLQIHGYRISHTINSYIYASTNQPNIFHQRLRFGSFGSFFFFFGFRAFIYLSLLRRLRSDSLYNGDYFLRRFRFVSFTFLLLWMTFHWEFLRSTCAADSVSVRSYEMQHQRIRASSHLKFQLNQLNRFFIGYWFRREFTIPMGIKQFCTCILNLLRAARKVCRTPCHIFSSVLSLVCYLSDDVRTLSTPGCAHG